MVNYSTFIFNRKVLFGEGSTSAALSAMEPSDHVLVISSKSIFAKVGTLILEPLARANIIFFACPISGEPSDSSIDEIVRTYYGEQITAVIGIGGGSTLDTAKAVSAMLRERKLTASYLEGSGTDALRGKRAPLILIPTTAGTGSEATSNAVILSGSGGTRIKKSLRHPNLIPDIIALDPQWIATLPAQIIRECACDCLSQLLESFLSVKSSAITDALCLEALYRFGVSFPKICADNANTDAASDMLFAAWSSGVCLTHAGLGTVHGLAGALGALTGLPHARICAGLLVPTFRIFEEKASDVWKNKAMRAAAALCPDSSSLSQALGAVVKEVTALKSEAMDNLTIRKVAASCNDRNSAVTFEAFDRENLLREVFSVSKGE